MSEPFAHESIGTVVWLFVICRILPSPSGLCADAEPETPDSPAEEENQKTIMTKRWINMLRVRVTASGEPMQVGKQNTYNNNGYIGEE